MREAHFILSTPILHDDPIPAATELRVKAKRGLLATDLVILNHGQETWTTPELAPPLLTTTPHQREDVLALDRFNVHRCPSRRVFSGTGLELVTTPATIRYFDHSATAAVEVTRGRCQLRCRPRTLTKAQNDVANSPRVALMCDAFTLLTQKKIVHGRCVIERQSTIWRRNTVPL
ncbi:uncharacterized protein TNCV_608781 [Trichonephila clavipes]|nr:uncharacterized protein TNCV_608781 [Trichonephila clavipes]